MFNQYGNYNPYGQGAAPQMQQRLNYLQQQYQQPIMPNQMSEALRGRVVTGMDEAKAAQIVLDGQSTFFPCPAEGKVYEKCLGLDGLPVFRVYQLAQNSPPVVYAERSSVDKLMERVDNLEKQLGVMNHEPNADVSNVTEQR